jgi:hypothetical protein
MRAWGGSVMGSIFGFPLFFCFFYLGEAKEKKIDTADRRSIESLVESSKSGQDFGTLHHFHTK